MEQELKKRPTARHVLYYMLAALGLILLPVIVLHFKTFLMLLALVLLLIIAFYAAYKIFFFLLGVAALIMGIVVLLSATGWLIHFFG